MVENGPILEFEKPIYELEKRIEEMKNCAVTEDLEALDEEIQRLEGEVSHQRQYTYSNLTRWQRVLIARHPNRPHTLD